MEAELADIRQFLSAHAPFDQLGEAEIETVARALTIRYLRRGSAFPPAEVAPALYLFRTGAAELRGTEHQLLDRLEEGDLFADACTNSSAGDTITGLVVEDSLVYTLDCPTLGTLREQSRTLDDYLDVNVSKRLRRALRRLQEATRGNLDFAELRARELMPTRDVCIEHDASIRAAGEKMMTQKTSGLLVMDNGRLAGLVTDHDLRKHCIVGTLSPDAEVREIMTTALYSIAPETPAFSALMEMTRRNIRHLPVVESGTPAGLLTATDFLRQQAARSVYIVSDIERCRTSDDVARACQALPEVQLQLVASGASAAHVQQAVAAIADAATRKLIQLAIDELGAAPVPFAWAAVGSQSRREMAAGSDQDNLLLIDDTYDPTRHGEWFTQLAERVNRDLAACGFALCPGDVMARNPQWRQPLSRWREYFHNWIQTPEPKAVMLACNFFDMRCIHGEERLVEDLMREAYAEAAGNTIFHAHLAANALKHRPPIGVFRNLVLTTHGEKKDTLDLKLNGLIPIVDIARLLVVAHGTPVISTQERLTLAERDGLLGRETAQNLQDSYEFIASLRLRHHAGLIERGEPADNFLDPAVLSSPERSHLKAAFKVIAATQATLAERHQTGRIA